jgi:uncharacterized protein YukE
MSDIETLRAALETIDTQGHSLYQLIRGVDAALAPAAPPGDPSTIEMQATAYQAAAKQSDSALEDMLKVKTSQLPQSWRGQAAESATQALQALHDWVAANQKALSTGDQTLSQWATQLRIAQQRDARAHEQLSTMRPLLQQLLLDDLISPKATAAGVLVVSRFRDAAAAACHDRLGAHELATSAADEAIKVLHDYATWAVDDVPVLLAPGIDPLTAVTLATDVEGALPEVTAGMRRAAQQLRAMSKTAGGRKELSTFEDLTASASSPLEASYLWRALGAGYTVQQVQAFGSVIHGHSNTWLIQHLDPAIEDPDRRPGIAHQFNAGTFKALNMSGTSDLTQGSEGDCVAASVVTAQMSADPVLTLAVTTGQGPMAQPMGIATRSGDDSPSATTARIQTLFNENYQAGQLIDHKSGVTDRREGFLGRLRDVFGWEPDTTRGIGTPGQIALDNADLSQTTGSSYQPQYLATASAREAVLPKIEAAVDAGNPVPIDVENAAGDSGHQMVIINHDSTHNEFEVYNPWGQTQWVTEQQFADSDLGALTDNAHVENNEYPKTGGSVLNTPAEVQLPTES